MAWQEPALHELLSQSVLDLITVLGAIILADGHIFISVEFVGGGFVLSIGANVVRGAHFGV